MQGLVASSAKVVGHARKGFTPAEPLPDKPCKSVFRVTAMPVGRPPVIVAETGPEPRPFKDLKALTVTEETISKTEAHFVNMIQTPMSGGDTSSGDELFTIQLQHLPLPFDINRLAKPILKLDIVNLILKLL